MEHINNKFKELKYDIYRLVVLVILVIGAQFLYTQYLIGRVHDDVNVLKNNDSIIESKVDRSLSPDFIRNRETNTLFT